MKKTIGALMAIAALALSSPAYAYDGVVVAKVASVKAFDNGQQSRVIRVLVEDATQGSANDLCGSAGSFASAYVKDTGDGTADMKLKVLLSALLSGKDVKLRSDNEDGVCLVKQVTIYNS